MNCEHLNHLLDAFVDAELDEATAAKVDAHLGQCAGCRGKLAQRIALSDALRRMPRHEMPASLAAEVRRRLDAQAGAAMPSDRLAAPGAQEGAQTQRRRWPGVRLRTPAWTLAGALAGFLLGTRVAFVPDPDLRESAIARHAAAFDAGAPQVQVASSDRHVVKPWFVGRVDFAPPVRDLAAQGFTLVGGRVDALEGRPAAAIVYRIRRHALTLFVLRAPDAAATPVALSAWRGFSVATWREGGLAFVALADTDPREVERFAELLRAAPP